MGCYTKKGETRVVGFVFMPFGLPPKLAGVEDEHGLVDGVVDRDRALGGSWGARASGPGT